MAPINLPDGTEVSEVILPDGASASEVIAPDGSTVFSTIPDPPDGGKLFRRFEANDITLSDGATVSTGDWVDSKASDGLTANGDPTFKTGVINGQDVVRTDGSGDNLTTTYSSVSQPFEVVVIGQFVSVNTSDNEAIVDDESSGVFGDHRLQNGAGSYGLWSGDTNPKAGSPDTNPHLHETIWRPSSQDDELYLDGTSLISGDTGDQPSNGLSLGVRASGDNASNFDFAEVFVYTDELSSSEQSKLENYAASKYGISI